MFKNPKIQNLILAILFGVITLGSLIYGIPELSKDQFKDIPIIKVSPNFGETYNANNIVLENTGGTVQETSKNKNGIKTSSNFKYYYGMNVQESNNPEKPEIVNLIIEADESYKIDEAASQIYVTVDNTKLTDTQKDEYKKWTELPDDEQKNIVFATFTSKDSVEFKKYFGIIVAGISSVIAAIFTAGYFIKK
jgi:hypothetical protein